MESEEDNFASTLEKIKTELPNGLFDDLKLFSSEEIENLDKDLLLKIFEFFKLFAINNESMRAELQNIDVVVQFYMTDEETFCWLEAQNGKIEYGRDSRENCAVTFKGTKVTLLGILSGLEDLIWCYDDGDIVVELSLQEANKCDDKSASIDGHRSQQGWLLMSIRGVMNDLSFNI